jgi:hypothetical protein
MPVVLDSEFEALVELFNDPRCNVELIEHSALHIVADFLCRGLVQRPGGQVELVDRHRVRMVRAPGGIVHGLLTLYQPIGDEVPWHPNVKTKPPYIICSNLENQVQRGPSVPYLSVVSLVWDVLSGAQWDASLGIYNTDAAKFYAAASARNELPFDARAVI